MAVKGYIGDAEVTLDNAAEQATLEAILKAIDKNADVNGDGILGKASKGLIKNSLNPLGLATKALTGSFTLLGKALGTVTALAGGIAKAGTSATVFSTGLLQSQASITDLTKAVKDSSLNVLGLGDALHALTELLYKDFTTFQQLTTSGIAFGDRMGTMAASAASTGVSLDVMAGALAQNSEQLANLGTATRGAAMAIGMSERAFDQNAQMLERFGLSYAEQTETFLGFVAQNAIALRRGTINQQQVIAQSDDYAKNLRRLSELTGIQADQIREGVEKANMNKAFENFIAGMDGETQQRMRSILDTAQAAFGDNGREAAMAMMMGTAPVTDGAQMLTTMMPGFNSQFASLTDRAKNFNGSLEDFNNQMLGDMNRFANANRGFADANSSYFGTLTLMGDAYGQAGSDIIAFVNKFGGNLEEVESKLGKTDSVSDAIITFNKAVADIREALGNLFKQVFKGDTFVNNMKTFADTIKNNTPGMVTAINNFVDTVSNYNPFDKKGRENIEKGAKQMWQDLLDWITTWWDTNGHEIFSKIGSTIQTALTDEGAGQGVKQITESNSRSIIDDITGKGLFNSSELTKGDNLLQRIIPGLSFRGDDIGNKLINDIVEKSGLSAFNMDFFGIGNKTVGDLERALNKIGKQEGPLDDETLKLLTELNSVLNNINKNTRLIGTYGATGKMVEPRNTLATIHAGERVLSPTETEAYNNMQTKGSTSTGSNYGMTNLANKLVDSNRDHNVKLTNALNMLVKEMQTNNRHAQGIITAIENA
jgi:hypothetical protein